MNCKERLESYLRENRVPFQIHHHPTAYTAQEVAASEHTPGMMVVKVVMVLVGDKLVMLAVPAPYEVDLEKTRDLLASEDARLAEEAEFTGSFPDCEVGAMPPFGNLYDVPVYVDEALVADEEIVFQAGTHTDTMRLAYADFERLVNPRVAAFAHQT